MLIRLLICLAAGTLFFPLMFGCITVPVKAAPETKVIFHGDETSEFWVCKKPTPPDNFECVPLEVFLKYYFQPEPSTQNQM